MSRTVARFAGYLGVGLFLLSASVVGLSRTNVAHANPASNEERTVTQPDGAVLHLRLWGDEFVHGWQTLDGFTVVKNSSSGYWEYTVRDVSGNLAPSGVVVGKGSPPVPAHLYPSEGVISAARRALRPALPAPAGPPKSGNVNIPVLLINFPDKGNIKTSTEYQNNLFNGGASGPGDLKDYYREVSYNALTLSSGPGGIPNWVTADNDRSYYNTYDRVRGLVTEAIQKADAAGFNFAPYDNDNNGSVDAVVVVYAGCAPYWGAGPWCVDPPPDAMWPHQWTLAIPVTVDGKQASVYTLQSELLWYTTMSTIGVFAHELGHTFELPDLYDIDYDSEGTGHWGLMGSGCWTSNNPGTENGESPAHMSAWEKWFMGWVTPTLIQGSTNNSSIPQVETNATVYQLLPNPGGVDWRFGTSGSGEYFLVENRQQTGFDRGLDGCGLLIWHVDETRPGDNTANMDENRRLVDLEEADGLEDLNGVGNRGDTGDPYRGSSGNTTFNNSSTPNSKLYSGAASGVSVSNISAGCLATMTADLSSPAGPAVGGIAEFPGIAGASAEEAGAVGDGSGWSAGGYAALAGGLAAAAIVIAGGAWYARRRWLR
jgi:M6 family metalloprotease-like protein